MKQHISKYSILNEVKEDLLWFSLSSVVFLLKDKVLGVSQDSTGFLGKQAFFLVKSQGTKLFQKKN